MSLKEIYGQLIKDTIKDQLEMRATTAKSELIASVLNLIPDRELKLDPVTIQLNEDGKELTISGELELQWDLPGIDKLKLSIKKLNWKLSDQENAVTSDLILGGFVSISGKDCTVTLTVTPENRILIEIQQLEKVSLEQLSELFLLNLLFPDTVKQFLEQTNSPLKQVDVCYDPATPGNLEITLVFEIGSISIISDKLEFSRAEALLQLVRYIGEDPPSPDLFSFQIETDIQLNNKPLQGVMRLEENQLVLSVNSQDDTLSIDNIAGLFMTPAAADDFSSELDSIGLKKFTISKATFYLAAASRKLEGCELVGNIILGHLKSNLSLSLPVWDYSGDLTQWESDTYPREDISLKTLLEPLGISAGIFPDLKIHSFVFSGSVGKRFLFSAEVIGDWDLLNGALTMTDITLEFSRESGPSIYYGFALKSFITLGGKDFFTSGVYDGEEEGWTFEGGTTDDSPINLRNFVDDCSKAFHLLSPPLFPNINIRNINISFQTTTGNIHFAAELDTKLTLPFLSDNNHNQFDASVEIELIHNPETGEKELNWQITNIIELSGSLFQMEYAEVENDFRFSFTWQKKSPDDSLELTPLFRWFGIDLDSIIDFHFEVSELCFEYQVSTQKIVLNGKTNDGANTFFIASRTGLSSDAQSENEGQWDFIFGYQFKGHSKLSDIPVSSTEMKNELKNADEIAVEQTGLIISSVAIKDFVIPPLPSLMGEQASDTGNGTIGPGTKLNLLKGLSAIAVIDFANEKSKQLKLIKDRSGDDHLIITASLNLEGNFFVKIVLQGGLAFDAGGGETLALENPYAEIQYVNKEPGFQIGGDIEITCDQHLFTVSPTFTLDPTQIKGQATITIADEGLQGLFGLQGLYLDQASVSIDVFEVPVPAVDIGIGGKAHIKGEAKAADEFAIIVELIEEVLNPRLFLISFQELSVASAMTMVTGVDIRDSLPDLVNQIKLTDVLYYWAETITTMPDNSIAQPGIRFNGNLEILNFKAHGDFAVGETGLSGMFEMSPIHFGKICSITGKGKGVSFKTIDGKRVYTAKSSADASETEIVPPGGPVGAFNAIHSPFLSVSIIVSLFDLINCEVEAEIGLTGMTFFLEMDVSDVEKAVLAMTLDVNGFEADSDFQLHIKTDLGPVVIDGIDFGTLHLDTNMNLTMTLAVGGSFILKLIGDFEFEGVTLKIPTLSINQPIPSLKDISTYLVNHLKDNFKTIFKEVIHFGEGVFNDARKDIEEIEAATDKEIKNLQKKIDTDTREIVSGAIQATRLLEATINQNNNDISNINSKIAETQKAAAETIEQIKSLTAEKTKEIANKISQTEQSTKSELKKIDKAIENEVALVQNQAAAMIADAGKEVSQILDQSLATATHLIDDATKNAQAVLNDAKNVAAKINQEAEKLWKEAEALAKKAMDEAKKTAQKAADTIKKGWHSIFG